MKLKTEEREREKLSGNNMMLLSNMLLLFCMINKWMNVCFFIHFESNWFINSNDKQTNKQTKWICKIEIILTMVKMVKIAVHRKHCNIFWCRKKIHSFTFAKHIFFYFGCKLKEIFPKFLYYYYYYYFKIDLCKYFFYQCILLTRKCCCCCCFFYTFSFHI